MEAIVQLNTSDLRPGDVVQQVYQRGLSRLQGAYYVHQVDSDGGLTLSMERDGLPVTDSDGNVKHWTTRGFRRIL